MRSDSLADQGPRPNFLTIFRDENDGGDSDNRFITAPGAFSIITRMEDGDIENYCDKTHFIITEKQFNFAKKFLAFIALTKGEGIATSFNDGAQIQNHLEVYFNQGILDQRIIQKTSQDDFNQLPIHQQIQEIADEITFDNIKKFYQRLLSKRPKLFTGAEDITENDHLINAEKKQHRRANGKIIQTAYDLENFISYLEMEVGALMLVSAPTRFISTAKRSGEPWVRGNGGEFQKETQLNLLVGARLEIADLAMEGLHVINRDEDQIRQLRASQECRIKPFTSSDAKAEDDKKKFWEIYDKIWEDIYQTSSDKKTDGEININLLIKRLTESYKLLILNAIEQEKKAGKKAYLRISPIGDGAWSGDRYQETKNKDKILEACGNAVAQIIKNLDQDQVNVIGAIEFAQFGGNALLLSFLKESQALFPNKPAQQNYQTIFPATSKDEIDESQIQLAKIMLKSKSEHDGLGDTVKIPIVNFCHKGDVNRKIPFAHLHSQSSEQYSQSSEQFPNLPTDDDLTAYITCPWDAGCRGIGNEYHLYENYKKIGDPEAEKSTLKASMDPVMACASPISLLSTDPEINQALLDNFHVIDEQGKKLSFDEFKINDQLKKHLKNLGYITQDSKGAYSGNDSLELDLKNNNLIFPASNKDLLLSFGIDSGAIEDISDSTVGSADNPHSQPKISIAITAENIAKLPRFGELKKIRELQSLAENEGESAGKINEARATKILEYNPIIPKLSELLKLQTTTPSRSPQEPQAIKILNFSNVWDNTNRANKYKILDPSFLYLQAGFTDDKIADSTINLGEVNKPKNDLFKYLFCKTFNDFNSQETSFTFQDAIDALLIAKTFGGLSNIKKDDGESYSQINQDNENSGNISPAKFIAKIKEKFPEEQRIQNLEEEKLLKFQTFSAKYQDITKHFFTSGRSPSGTTGLRLTFFPDQLIAELVKLNPKEVRNYEATKNLQTFISSKLAINQQ